MSAAGSGRLVAWASLAGVLATLSYAGRLAEGKPPEDILYRYTAAIAGLVQYAVMLGLVLLISAGLAKRELLGLRRPASWPRAAALAFAVLVGVGVLSALLEPLLHAGEEQGLTPERWERDRAVPFAANFVVIAGVAPVVEELMFRGLGFGLLRRFGTGAAIVLVGVAFALAHGLIAAFPILFAFGSGLAYLRSRTGSVYPGMILHGAFNAIALVAAVAL